MITTESRAAFLEDGVVKVPGALDSGWIDGLLEYAERELADPGPWTTDTNSGATADRLFTSRYRWRDDPFVRDYVHSSPVAAIAADLCGSATMRFYFDHLLVKEPRTSTPTPWHQDIGYWPFLGKQIVTAWVAGTASPAGEPALEFVRGSHLWNAYYAPESFDDEAGWTDDFEGDPMPDIEAARSSGDRGYDIVGFAVEPGDAIVFSAWMVHGAPANLSSGRRVALATRWLGDDAVWHPHPGCDPTVGQADTTDRPGHRLTDDDRFPLIHPQSL